MFALAYLLLFKESCFASLVYCGSADLKKLSNCDCGSLEAQLWLSVTEHPQLILVRTSAIDSFICKIMKFRTKNAFAHLWCSVLLFLFLHMHVDTRELFGGWQPSPPSPGFWPCPAVTWAPCRPQHAAWPPWGKSGTAFGLILRFAAQWCGSGPFRTEPDPTIENRPIRIWIRSNETYQLLCLLAFGIFSQNCLCRYKMLYLIKRMVFCKNLKGHVWVGTGPGGENSGSVYFRSTRSTAKIIGHSKMHNIKFEKCPYFSYFLYTYLQIRYRNVITLFKFKIVPTLQFVKECISSISVQYTRYATLGNFEIL